jgi:hypothetical protein
MLLLASKRNGKPKGGGFAAEAYKRGQGKIAFLTYITSINDCANRRKLLLISYRNLLLFRWNADLRLREYQMGGTYE